MFPDADNKYEVAVVIINATAEHRISTPMNIGKPFTANVNIAESGSISGKITMAVVARMIVNPTTIIFPNINPNTEFLATFSLLDAENL